MRALSGFLVSSLLLTSSLVADDLTEEVVVDANPVQETVVETTVAAATAAKKVKPFSSFTGKVLRDRVRLRLHPNLEAAVFQELGKDDLLVVSGETDEFYAVSPPPSTKAYVFRTYILDDVVEGNHVNVRLQPDTEAPILGQLNAGDKIEGHVSPVNPKWLEIDAPKFTRFYVYKDYVENIGDEHLYALIEARREEVNRLLETAEEKAEQEFAKDFSDIDIAGITAQLTNVINHYQDFPQQHADAEKELKRVEELYLQRKISFLENQEESTRSLANKNRQLSTEVLAKQERIQQLEKQIRRKQAVGEDTSEEQAALALDDPYAVTHKMMGWMPIEEELYTRWLVENEEKSLYDFYSEQAQESQMITGIVNPYDRPIKNRPGDFVVINPETKLPVAFIYSTKVNLETLVGKQVTMEVSQRPNHHFAYPAYYVLDLQHSLNESAA